MLNDKEDSELFRVVLIVIVAGIMLASSGVLESRGISAAFGAPADSPKTFIQAVSDSAIRVLHNRELSEQDRVSEFRRLFAAGLDFRAIGRAVLGRHWKRATADDRQAFQLLFWDYVINTYAARLARYSIEELTIGESRSSSNGDETVSTTVVAAGGASTRIDWRVRKSSDGDPSGGYKIVDMAVEGMSMALTQRSEFASVIRRDGGILSGLISRLRTKLAQN
jgi:phospholipid transport system substrate-binding protein